MAKILDGNAIAQDLLSDVAKEIRQLQDKRPHFKPTLAIIQVGERIHNHFPIDHIREKANDVGIEARLIKLNKDTTQSDLEKEIDTLNNDPDVDGITCQTQSAPRP
ncbi:C1-tetrahydrofolate synthase [Aphelenchoides avenae]|nr:C1-tetrahydrofolate synthase [Aphelenchus avenae]